MNFCFAPNFEKVGSILVLPCVSICLSLCSKKFKARVLKFHILIPHQKKTDPYIPSCSNYLPLWRYALFKGSECNVVSKISRKLLKLGASNLVS